MKTNNRTRIAILFSLLAAIAIGFSGWLGFPGGHAVGYTPPGTLTPVTQILPDGGTNYGGYLSDAGAASFTDAGTPNIIGCDVCADDGNSGTIYCAVDPSVNATPASPHKGIPLSPTTQACRFLYAPTPSAVYCAQNDAGAAAYIHCY